MEKTKLFMKKIDSPLGKIILLATEKSLCLVEFYNSKYTNNNIEKVKKYFNGEIIEKNNDILNETEKQLNEYFKGERKDFNIPLEMIGTEFQKKIWNILLEIPYGKTISYEEQSIRYRNVKAIRAVANANSKNLIAIIIPCHRVIGKNGKLTGYAGGLDKKKWLLNFEKK
ncbi:MAG: methylated-DNA-[protein]-cysteine S-methyltransferase [Fusobacteriaceae bacterium]|jgi:O-6-methylguanine DNA methyltransferase|nr:methylated-DNA-[protein]-cysteine S-methyltransferase [Fusobacteriaceae bacterium]